MPSKERPWGITYEHNGAPGSRDFPTDSQRKDFLDRIRNNQAYKKVVKLPKFAK